jgi:steroid delta-isomerase-like uncharacterized protein
MDAAEIEALMRRWFDEVWNQKRPDRIHEMLSADAVAHGMGPNGTTLKGSAAFEAVYHQMIGIFPDVQITVERVVAAGDMGTALFTCRATHRGDGLGIPATGRPVCFSAMTMARFRDGRIVEGWNVLDLLAAVRQASATSVAAKLP